MNLTVTIDLRSGIFHFYNMVGIDSVKLKFALDNINLFREENTLIITMNDGSGAKALLSNYFTKNETGTLPCFELEDGRVLSGVDFLKEYGIDIFGGSTVSAERVNSSIGEVGSLDIGVNSRGLLNGRGRGSMDNVITLNGQIGIDGLDINKTEGWTQLVLTASSLDEYMQWYGDWLKQIINSLDFTTSIGINAIEVRLPDAMSFDSWLGALSGEHVDAFSDLVRAFQNLGVDTTYNNGDGNHEVYQDQTQLTKANSSLFNNSGASQSLRIDDSSNSQGLHPREQHYSNVFDMGGVDDSLSIIDTDLTDGVIIMRKGNNHLALVGNVILANTSIDGGHGYDVLELGDFSVLRDSNNTLHLSTLVGCITGFELLDISGDSGSLHIDLDSLQRLGIDSADSIRYTLLDSGSSANEFDINSLTANNTLVIKANSSDAVSFSENWHDLRTQISDGRHEYEVYATSGNDGQYFILLQLAV